VQELRKQTDDEELQAGISKSVDIIQSVLDSANDPIDKKHLAFAAVDLSHRVGDWKALKVEGLGELMMSPFRTVNVSNRICYLSDLIHLLFRKETVPKTQRFAPLPVTVSVWLLAFFFAFKLVEVS
jgi:hypothetical protein